MTDVPLGQYALLSDCRSAALVSAAGSIDWLCLPRFDSPATFGRLLDEEAGHFSVAPATADATARWAYRPNSLVLDTTWTSAGGEVVVTDTLALGPRERGHDLGQASPGVLLRQARCTRGSVALRVEFVPRPEFGLIHPRLSASSGQVVADGGARMITLSTDAELDLTEATAVGVVVLAAGDELSFALQQVGAWGPPGRRWTSHQVGRRIKDAERAWQSWSGLRQHYQGPLAELVRHSGVVLQGLTYARSGALVAAPTTSLPEGVGTGRTWDYRFTWIRDASLTMQGLYVAACPDEAGRFFAFLARAASTQLQRGQPLQIMFGVEGERDLSERELPHLSGWRDSGPVRVGNGAWTQRQLDVYGSLLDAAYTFRDQLNDLEQPARSFLVDVVAAAALRWRDDDQGIWEDRGPARPFLHSKLMCWVALDRGIQLAEHGLINADRVADWRATREEIREAILTRGWNEHIGAFTQSFGSEDLDAAVLLIVTMGFLPSDDPRLLATIDAIEEALSDDRGLLYRYRNEDGFPPEGTFLLCTFWLAQALAVVGQLDRARATLRRAAGYATELGLLAEQVDPVSGELLANFPQAFSHLGLIIAAQALADAEASDH